MINGTFQEFWEFIKDGMDVALRYRGHLFFMEGFWKPDIRKHFFYVADLSKKDDPNDVAAPYYIWCSESDSMEENARRFLDAKIFFGQSFREIEDVVEWPDVIEEWSPGYAGKND